MDTGERRLADDEGWQRSLHGLGLDDRVVPGLRELLASPIQGSSLDSVLARFDVARLWEAQGAPFAQRSLLDADLTAFSQALKPVMDAMSRQWAQVLAPARSLIMRFTPPNWHAAPQVPPIKRIKQMLLTEDIPIMWVPAAPTLKSIFRAPDAAARRRVITRRRDDIISDCRDALATTTARRMQQPAVFAASALDALSHGHPDASQALSANLIDSLLRVHYDAGAKKFHKRKKTSPQPDMSGVELFRALTLAAIWAAYQVYEPQNGDHVPATFGRHPSAHAVSRRQYSRTNATIAAMLSVSLIKQLDHELTR